MVVMYAKYFNSIHMKIIDDKSDPRRSLFLI